MGTSRIKLSVYVTEQQRREIKGLCGYLGVGISYFVNVAIADKIKKERTKANKNKA